MSPPAETGASPTATASPSLADSALEFLRQLADEGAELCPPSDVVTQCIEAYVASVTETELERHGVLVRALHSRALVVKAVDSRRA